MIPRRDLVTGAILGGVAAAAPTADAAGAEPQASDQAIERVASAISQLRTELRDQYAFDEIEVVRRVQKQFLRANGKMPDYLDIGMDVWFAVHDWHVRWQQPLTLGRDQQGRLTVLLMGTTLVLRSDQAGNFLGIPYDNR